MDTSPITITVLNRINAEMVLEDNPMFELVEEKTGVKLEVDAPPISNYTDRLQLVMASGDIPDIIYTWGFNQNYEKWAEDGMLRPVYEAAQDYPNLMTNISEDQWNAARVGATGKIHAVPRTHHYPTWGVIVNEKWLDTLDQEWPETTDELMEYGRRVISEDPDGNGKDDTFLVSPVGLWTDCWIVFAFMPFSTQHRAPYLPDRDGEYKLKEKMSGYMPYLDYMREMYAEGIMDPEWFTNKYYDDRTKFKQQRVATCHGDVYTGSGFGYGEVEDSLNTFGFRPALVQEKGEKPVNEAGAATWGGWMVNADIDDYTFDRVMGFLDWGNSKEGFITIGAGVQGLDYESYDFDKRELIVLEEQRDNRSRDTSVYMNIANAYDNKLLSFSGDPEINEITAKNFDKFMEEVEQIQIPTVKCPEIDNWAAEYPDIATQKQEIEVSYVVGEVDKEEFEAFLNDVYFPSVAEAEEAYLAKMAEYEASR